MAPHSSRPPTPLPAFCLLPFAFCLLLASASTGWSYAVEDATYPDGQIVMRLSITAPSRPLTDGRTSRNDSAADALKTWNPFLERVQFVSQTAGTVTPMDGDGINSVFDTDNIYGDTFDKGVLAVTLLDFENGTMMETDVLLNNHYYLDSYDGPLRSSATPTLEMHRVLLHEFGHVLGLDHPDDYGQTVEAIMNSHVGDLDHLTADDIAGAHHLYDEKLPPVVVVPAVTLKAPAASSISQNAAGALKFRIRRVGTVTSDSPGINVGYSLQGTAINGVNYKALTGRASIGAGFAQVKIKLHPQPDSITNGNPVSVIFSLSSGSNSAYTVTGTGTATVEITP